MHIHLITMYSVCIACRATPDNYIRYALRAVQHLITMWILGTNNMPRMWKKKQ